MLLDLILILLILLIGFIGYKVGFLVTIIKFASLVGGLILAIVLVKPTTNFVTDIGLDNALETRIYENITTSDAFVKYADSGSGVEGVTELLEELGIPGFLSEMIADKLYTEIDLYGIATEISDTISYAITSVIVFICLLLFSSLAFWILKKIVSKTRDSVGFIRVTDGLVGIVFYEIIFVFVIYLILLIIGFIWTGLPADSGFAVFLTEQLHLEDDKFGLAKYFYQNNIIKNFFDLIF
jgi:hypothetical protein